MASSTLQRLSKEVLMGKYRYQGFPIDGKTRIRIATLHAGAFEEDVIITLRQEIFDRNQKLIYEAVSYTWGPEEDNPALILAQHRETGSATFTKGWMPVRKNLLSVLRHLRSTTDDRDIWIDAICIDQEDNASKGPQLAVMGRIYQHAVSVIIWLGDAADDSDMAIGALKGLGEQVYFDWDIKNFVIHASKHTTDPAMLDPGVTLNLSEQDLFAIYKLSCRPWFERLWIRQEVTLANMETALVQCGSLIVPWKVFRNALGLIIMKPLPHYAFLNKLLARLLCMDGMIYQLPLARLDWYRQDFGDSICSDPRDRIYAVRDLLSKDIRRLIVPDYTKDAAGVYRDAVLAHLRKRDLDVLRECQFTANWPGPSWVPDWSMNRSLIPIDYFRRWMASGMITRPWEVTDFGRTLRVAGIRVAELERTKSILFQNGALEAAGILLASETRPLTEQYAAVRGTLFDAYVRTLCDDRFDDNWDGSTPYLSWEEARRELWGLKDGEVEQKNPFSNTAPGKLKKTLENVCQQRVFFHTTSGLIGLAPQSAAPGDIVCAVFGATVLLLLRPAGDGYGHVLIGECAMCGFSCGEAVLGCIPQSVRAIQASVTAGSKSDIAPVFEDTRTGARTRVDPRLEDLGLDLTDYRKQLTVQVAPWLKVDQERLVQCLATKGVSVDEFNLV